MYLIHKAYRDTYNIPKISTLQFSVCMQNISIISDEIDECGLMQVA